MYTKCTYPTVMTEINHMHGRRSGRLYMLTAPAEKKMNTEQFTYKTTECLNSLVIGIEQAYMMAGTTEEKD